MAITYGLTLEGLVIKTLPVLRAEGNSRLQGKFGTSIDVSDESVEGQMLGILSEALALLWELSEGINNARDVDKATGALLEGLCLLTGTFRVQASFSAVVLTLTGLPTTPIPSPAFAEVEETGRQFQTEEDTEIVAVAAWLSGTLYSAGSDLAHGARVTNVGNVYVCSQTGTTGGGPGPIGTVQFAEETDGGAKWRLIGTGTGAVDVISRATETGPILAAAASINKRASPLGGWSSVLNLIDATPGNLRMTDEQLRVLRELELARPGTSPADAIRADLLGVTGVTAVTVFVNNGDTVVDGMPPHSVEALVDGGVDQDIWNQLLISVAAGIGTHGTEVGTATDKSGNDQTMKFSRVELVPIWVAIALSKVANDSDDPTSYPADGDTQVKLTVATAGNAQGNGRNAVASAIGAPSFIVTGVLDVTSVLIGLSNPPVVSTTIPITRRQRAAYDTVRVAVTSVDGDP